MGKNTYFKRAALGWVCAAAISVGAVSGVTALTVSAETTKTGARVIELPVIVEKKVLTGIKVKSAPDKTAYNEGEQFAPNGLVITATYSTGSTVDVAYAEGTKGDFGFSVTGALSVSDTKVTITYGGKSVDLEITVTESSSGGSGGSTGGSGGSSGGSGGSSGGSGGSSGGSGGSSGGSASSSAVDWDNAIEAIRKAGKSDVVSLELNGETNVPAKVTQAMSETGCTVRFVVDATRCWVLSGSDITAPSALDLTMIKTSSLRSGGLSGVEGMQFTIYNVNAPAGIELNFGGQHSGKFANLYRAEGDKFVCVTSVKTDTQGKVLLANAAEAGSYIVMLHEMSSVPGDMNNDGTLNALDAAAILKHVVGKEQGVNLAMADFDKNEAVNALDAAAILKFIVGK